ncbi:hypothetical protein SB767_25415 [Bacillus sp. SIMBA_069]
MAKNKLNIKVDADTTEALKQMKEVTVAANECVEAFERLERKLAKFNSPFPQIIVKGLVNPVRLQLHKDLTVLNSND